MCVCVCVCVCVCACVRVECVCGGGGEVSVCVRAFVLYALNLENMCIQQMCKRLGHVRVRRPKSQLLLLSAAAAAVYA